MSPTHDPSPLWRIDAAALAVMLAMTAGAYLLVVKPAADQRAEQSQQAQRLADDERRAADLLADRRDLDAQLADLRQRLDASPVQLLPADRLNHRLAEITELATEIGLNLEEVQPGSTERHERYRSTEIRLTGTGGYRDCALFMHRLNERFGDLGVESWRLTARPGGDAAFRLDLLWHTAPRTPAADGS